MGEATLVDRDIDDGAFLIQEFDSTRTPVTLAFWGHLADLNEWRLFIAMPNTPYSRAERYGLIQRILKKTLLDLPLSRISLIESDEAPIQSVRTLIASERGKTHLVPLGPLDVAGQFIDRGYAYRTEALHFERSLASSLRRLWVPGSMIEPRGGFGATLADPVGLPVDFILNSPQKVILVEAKAKSEPVGDEILNQATRWRDRGFEFFGKEVWFLCVSRSGFRASTKEQARQLEFLVLVHWRGARDDQKLSEALNVAQSPGHA